MAGMTRPIRAPHWNGRGGRCSCPPQLLPALPCDALARRTVLLVPKRTRDGGPRLGVLYTYMSGAARSTPPPLCADSVASSRSAAKAHRNSRRRRWSAAKMPDVEHVEVVLANNDRVTLRVGDVFLKIDADQTRTDVEVEAMAMAPVPTPQILWRKPPALALAAVPGKALGRLEAPSTASPAAWAAAGAAIRRLHDAPLPPWPGKSVDELASRLDG